MPSSCPYNISRIVHIVWKLRPKSILDIGCGMGKYGVLFREYLDNWYGRYKKENWEHKIDAIEGYEGYITDLHKAVYDKIETFNFIKSTWSSYEMLFLGDVIEHFFKEDGIAFLERQRSRWILISTPAWWTKNESSVNPLETHRSLWEPKDFEELKNWKVNICMKDRGLLTVLLERKE